MASTTRDAPVGLLGRDRWISTEPGVRIHVIDAGVDRGQPPLVLIPGWRLTATIWEHQIQAFSRDRRVIAVDPRSQGASTVTGEGNTPEHRPRDLQTVLSTLDLHAIVLVG